MGKLEKATDLYLRGFNSQYIKRRTDISMQSLLKQLLAKGIKYTKDDIFSYQVQYIRSHYTDADIMDGYRQIITQYKDPTNAKRGRNVECLGCAFGDYVRVFKALLGNDAYKALRNECWHKKQVESVQRLYGVDNVFCKETFSQVVTSEAVADGRRRRTETMVARYGFEHPNQNPDIAQKMVQQCVETNLSRYGVSNPMQRPDVATKSANNRQKTMLRKYGAKNSTEIDEIRDKIFDSRKRNGTLNTSRAEDALYYLLCERFGKDDVFRNVIVDNRYPYHVDYYVKSLDLFIELNGDKCHNDHWYDSSNERDVQIVHSWLENADKVEASTGKPSRYRKYIKTWTETDVAKRNAARLHNLNYLVFWDGACIRHNKNEIPRLQDARDWFAANCPMPNNWRPANTY